MTIWFIFQGWQIATGQSRNSMRSFITRSVQLVLVMAIAQGSAIFGKDLVGSINGLKDMVSLYVTGKEYKSTETMIDGVFGAMAVLQDVLNVPVQNSNSSALAGGLNFITGMGQAVPALISGGLLLLNQIALNLCIVFAPLFIVCYLFDVTKPFFNTWVKFTVSTLFSMAVVSVIVIVAMKAVLVVSATILAADLASGGSLRLREIATVQGGLGMMMSTLLLGGPPLVTNFFSGAVAATFSGYNPISGMASGNPAGSQEDAMSGRSALRPNTQKNNEGSSSTDTVTNLQNKKTTYGGGSSSTTNNDPGQRGNADPKTKGK